MLSGSPCRTSPTRRPRLRRPRRRRYAAPNLLTAPTELRLTQTLSSGPLLSVLSISERTALPSGAGTPFPPLSFRAPLVLPYRQSRDWLIPFLDFSPPPFRWRQHLFYCTDHNPSLPVSVFLHHTPFLAITARVGAFYPLHPHPHLWLRQLSRCLCFAKSAFNSQQASFCAPEFRSLRRREERDVLA